MTTKKKKGFLRSVASFAKGAVKAIDKYQEKSIERQEKAAGIRARKNALELQKLQGQEKILQAKQRVEALKPQRDVGASSLGFGAPPLPEKPRKPSRAGF